MFLILIQMSIAIACLMSGVTLVHREVKRARDFKLASINGVRKIACKRSRNLSLAIANLGLIMFVASSIVLYRYVAHGFTDFSRSGLSAYVGLVFLTVFWQDRRLAEQQHDIAEKLQLK